MELYVLVPNFWKALQSWWREEVNVLDGEGVDVRLEGAQEGGEVQERRLDKFYHFIISGAPGYHH